MVHEEESRLSRLHNSHVKMRISSEKLQRELSLLQKYRQKREEGLLKMGFQHEEIELGHLNLEWSVEEGWISFLIFNIHPEIFKFLLLADVEVRPLEKEYIDVFGNTESTGLAVILSRLAK